MTSIVAKPLNNQGNGILRDFDVLAPGPETLREKLRECLARSSDQPEKHLGIGGRDRVSGCSARDGGIGTGDEWSRLEQTRQIPPTQGDDAAIELRVQYCGYRQRKHGAGSASAGLRGSVKRAAGLDRGRLRYAPVVYPVTSIRESRPNFRTGAGQPLIAFPPSPICFIGGRGAEL